MIAYCERKGNERLVKPLGRKFLDSHTAWSLRADKYNKKINRYRVEVEEADTSEEEDIEREIKESKKVCISYINECSSQAGKATVKFGHLDRKRSRAGLSAKEPEAESEQGSDAERIDGSKDCNVAWLALVPAGAPKLQALHRLAVDA